MVAITPLPDPPSTSDPANFATKADALLGALPTFVTEANAYAAYLAAAAQPAAAYIALVWVSGTSGDPGDGAVGGDDATQNASTALRIDNVDAIGNSTTAIADSMDNSTSTLKGFLRVQKVGDPTKWLLFRVTGAVVDSTGYRTVPVSILAGSASSPFTAADAVVITFTPTGDKGDPNNWQDDGSLVTISGSPSTITLSSLPTTNSAFKVDLKLTSSGGGVVLRAAFSSDGSTFGSSYNITTAIAAYYGSIIITDYRGKMPRLQVSIADGASYSSLSAYEATETKVYQIEVPSGLSAMRLSPASGNFVNGGTYQRRVL